MEIGNAISKSLKIAKITVVFDQDVDIHNTKEVLACIRFSMATIRLN
ncbi:MAG: hypothetical protein Ct9H300mP4_08070 [Gammaproteobacteria bacterium]|nr:MAG: hypothetical protein Ct9H300mP4_08070 [Gammaproteobacteria bacterium]